MEFSAFWRGFQKKANTSGLPRVQQEVKGPAPPRPPKATATAPSNQGVATPKVPSPRIKGVPRGKSVGGKQGVNPMRI